MKNIYFVLLSLIIIGCTSNPKTTTVTLDLKNVEKGEFRARLPTDGVASIAILDTLRFYGDTVIQIPIKTNGGLVSMTMFGQKLKTIQTVCGDGDFTIFYNPADSLMPIRYEGINAEGRALIQQMSSEHDPYKYEWVRDFSKYPIDTTGAKLSENFEKLTSDDIAKFDSLLASGSIDQQFYDYAKLDAEVYHALSMGKAIRADWITKNGDTKSMYEGYVDCWDNIYSKLPLTTAIYSTIHGSIYADLYIEHYIPFCNSKTVAQLPKFTSQTEYFDSAIAKADSTLKDVELRKLYVGSFLFSEALNNKTRDSGIVPYLDSYISAYPESRLNSYFNRHKIELDSYRDKIEKSDTSRIHFVENSDQITTLYDLLSKFKGRPVFLDFWFTTCGSCLEEFAVSGDLKKFLAEKGVEILYISIDKKEDDWMNAIKFNELYGNHIRASQPLHEDIFKVHGVYSYPTYMIVDADGKIVVPRANYPSSGQALLDQLTETLNLK